MSAHAERSIAGTGLCLSDFMALEALLHKGPLTIGEIRAKVLLASGSMTAAIDRLENLGLVRRDSSETDRRARVIHLTSKGSAEIRSAYRRHTRDLEAAAAVLSDLETETLYGLVRKLGLFAASAAGEKEERE